MGSDEAVERRAGGPPPGARRDVLARVAAGLSHEVRNPLNALAIHLEVLADKLRRDGGGTIPTHLEKNLAAARAQVARVDAVVKRFSDFAGAREREDGPVDARALVEEVAGLCRHEAGRRGLELIAVAPEGLALDGGGPALAWALVALVIGLVDVGVGGGRVGLHARAEGDRGAIVVAEEGGGLDATVARDALAAAGVGDVVEAWGGTVTVEVAGTGAAVVLRLPLARRERSGAVA